MRGGYIHRERHWCKDGSVASKSQCRGGIASGHPEYNDYEVEIGQLCNFSMEMFALCCMHDEIIEYLKKDDSHIGRLLYSEYRRQVQQWSEENSKRSAEIDYEEKEYVKIWEAKREAEKKKEKEA